MTGEPGRLQSMGSQRVRHDLATDNNNMPSSGVTGSYGGFWRKKWQLTPVFLPGKPHGQRSLAGYSPWGHKELDTTQWLTHTQ